MSITTFPQPPQRIALNNGRYNVELWPNAGGGIARFDYLPTPDTAVEIFRPARLYDKYPICPTNLSCYPLVPYSNRIENGLLHFAGENHQLALNFFEGNPHSLHGFGWQRVWDAAAQSATSCTLTHLNEPNADWPFRCLAKQEFALKNDGLVIRTSVTNLDNRAMPCGLGQHPHIVRPAGTILVANMAGVWHNDATGLPTHRTKIPAHWQGAANEILDFKKGQYLDNLALDHCFDGRQGNIKVLWADQSQLIIASSKNMRHTVIYNPIDQEVVCIEPVTHLNNGFNRMAAGQKDTGTIILPPSATAMVSHRFIYQPRPR